MDVRTKCVLEFHGAGAFHSVTGGIDQDDVSLSCRQLLQLRLCSRDGVELIPVDAVRRSVTDDVVGEKGVHGRGPGQPEGGGAGGQHADIPGWSRI